MPNILLRASDGHEFDAHRVDPLGPVHGGVVVVQEIFGVNRHMRAVAARFAAAGWSAIVPAFFDRVERGVELGYEPADFTRGRELVGKLQMSDVLLDLQAAIDALRDLGTAKGGECPKPTGTVGYCWGGAVVWLGAARLHGLDAAISYYGSRIVNYVDEPPRVPTMLHVGRADASLPIEKVRELGRRYGDLVIHEYEAGHGFDCDHRPDFESTASAHAMTRTLAWLDGSAGD
jgi:carboxymethylenebutenolidase